MDAHFFGRYTINRSPSHAAVANGLTTEILLLPRVVFGRRLLFRTGSGARHRVHSISQIETGRFGAWRSNLALFSVTQVCT